MSDNSLRDFYENDYYRDLSIASIPADDDFVYGQVLRELRPFLKTGLKVLDLGCNNGNLSLYMAKKGCDVTGIDFAGKAVDTASRSALHHRIATAQFFCMDFVTEWSGENVFDLVLCSHVIEHVPNDKEFLGKIYFALKPSGRLLLFTPCVHSSLMKISKIFTGKYRHDEEVGHLRRYRRTGLSALVAEAGFDVRKTVYLDGMLRDWFLLFRPARIFNTVWKQKYIRSIFNVTDRLLASIRVFPAALCVHAVKNKIPESA